MVGFRTKVGPALGMNEETLRKSAHHAKPTVADGTRHDQNVQRTSVQAEKDEIFVPIAGSITSFYQ